MNLSLMAQYYQIIIKCCFQISRYLYKSAEQLTERLILWILLLIQAVVIIIILNACGLVNNYISFSFIPYMRRLYTGLRLLCNLIAIPIPLAINLNSGLRKSLP